MRVNRASVASGGVLAATGVLLVLAGAAFACTPTVGILTVGPPIAAADAALRVEGRAMRPNVPVELRWNGTQGPVLGVVRTNSEGAFTTSVIVPRTQTGPYSVVAAAPNGLVRAPLYVAAAGAKAGSLLADSGSAVQGRGQAVHPVLAGAAVLGAVGLLVAGAPRLAPARRARARS